MILARTSEDEAWCSNDIEILIDCTLRQRASMNRVKVEPRYSATQLRAEQPTGSRRDGSIIRYISR